MKWYFKVGFYFTITLIITGGWLLFFPRLWVNGPDGPHDLILQVTDTQLQSGRIYNVTFGHSIVRSDGSKWVPTNETIAEHWVSVTNICKLTSMIMITVKNGHLVLPDTRPFLAPGIQATDPPQFV